MVHRCSNFSSHIPQLEESAVVVPVQSQSHRSVLVLDRSFDYLSWLQTTNHSKYGDIHHPSSRHMISSYSNYVYQNHSYHFNSMGEQSSFLNISPGQRLDDDYAADTVVAADQIPIEAIDHESHSLLIWPDRLLISNIQRRDVPSMSSVLVKEAAISADTIESLAASSPSQLSSSIRVESLAPSHAAELIVIIHVSRTLSYDRSLQIKQWFDECFTAKAADHQQQHHHYPQSKVSFFLTNVVKPDRSISSASVTVLPVERSYYDVISRKAVQLIVDDACKGLLLRTAPS